MTSFRNLLEAGDLDGLLAHWAKNRPGMPQPENREQAEIIMHHARTGAESLPLKARAWSHRWLCERDLPSGLPDRLKPSAERLYPAKALAVGISVNMRSEWMRPAMTEVRGAMEYAVLDAEADGKLADSPFVTERMNEAKAKAFKALFGIKP